jgi:hypothetical protein
MILTDFFNNLSQGIPVAVLLLIFLLVISVVAISVWIFFYHWDHYGTNSITTLLLKATYLIGIMIFIAISICGLILY